jgi:recombination protein RecA
MGDSYKDWLKEVGKRYDDAKRVRPLLRDCRADPAVVEAISTGSLQVDRLTGIGGIPRGRITEISGPTGAGKTTLALGAIRSAQRDGERALFVDVERTFHQRFAEALGVSCDPDRFALAEPEFGEEALDIAESAVRSGHFGIVVVDSVAEMASRKEIDGSNEDNFVGLQSRMMGQGLRKLNPAAASAGVAVVFINQQRAKIGGYGNPITTPGGAALPYYASLRLEAWSGGKDNEVRQGTELLAYGIRVKLTKTKVGPHSKREVFPRVYLDGGVSLEYDALVVGRELGLLRQAGAHWSFGEEKLGAGFDNAIARLRAEPRLLRAILDAIAASGLKEAEPEGAE